MAWWNSAHDAGINLPDPTKGLSTKGISVPKAPGYNVDESAFVDPYHDANASRFWGGAESSQNRTGNEQFRNGQADLISTLQGAINGNAPSVAENQLRAGADRALAGATGMAASGMGATNPALALRAINNAHANIAQSTARDAATLRAGEIAQARGELGNVLGAARAGDLQQGAQNDALTSKYLDLGYSNDQAAQMAAAERERLKAQVALGTQSLNAQTAGGNRDFWANIAGAGLNAAGTAGAAMISDERKKKNVTSGGDEVRAFLDKIAAKGFDYKDSGPGAAPGRHAGIMAQDLEKAGPIGRGMVTSASGTKTVDGGQAAGAALAASADLNDRVKRLEGKQGANPSAPAAPRFPRAPAPAPAPRYERNNTPGARMIRWITGQPAESAIPGGMGG